MRNLKKMTLWWIMGIAAFLRLVALDRLPIALNWDEVSMGYSAYSILTTGKDEWGSTLPLFFRSYGEWKSAVYIYLIVPLVKIFGLNAWSVRLPSALAGIAAVYLMYHLGKALYSRRLGLWMAALMAVTPWHVVISRPAFEANVALTLLLLGVYGIVRAVSTPSLGWAIVAGLGFALAPHTYNSAKLVVPILACVLVWQARKELKLRHFLVMLAIWVCAAVPILINFQSGISQKRYTQVGLTTELDKLNAFIAYRASVPGPALLGKALFNRVTYTLYHVTDNLLSYTDPAYLIASGGPHNQYRVPLHGILYAVEFFAALLGCVVLFRRRPSHAIGSWLPYLLIILGVLPAALTKGDHHVLRSLLALPGWLILAAHGLDILGSKPRIARVAWSILALEIIIFLVMYFGWYGRATASDWQYGYKEAIAYVTAHADQYDRVVMTKWYGEPQLFVAFYTRWDPIDFQRESQGLLRYESEGRAWLDQLEPYQVGRWEFKYLSWVNEAKQPRTLYIGKPDDFWPDSHIVSTIKYPNGQPAFLLVEP
jgi:4-amino-4-deoxy-L-arabinose transferase-like glycosyltransferase